MTVGRHMSGFGRWHLIVAGLGLMVCAPPSAVAQGPCQAKNRICQHGICDGEGDPATVTDQKMLGQWDQGARRILLNLSPRYGMGWASIEGGAPGDAMWLDRSSDGGQCWEEHLGLATIPQGLTTWRTMMYSYVPGGVQLRACGRSSADGTVSCTPWLPVCEDASCDGKDPQGAVEHASNPTSPNGQRHVVLHISDPLRMAWASIEDGSPGDEVWLDRWWDGQPTWDGLLGRSMTPAGRTAWRTWMFHFNDVPHRGAGRLRACGRQAGTQNFICTDWFRPLQWPEAFLPPPSGLGTIALAADVLVAREQYDHDRGYWYHPETAGNGWWQSGSVLASLIEYMIRTGDHRHRWIVDRTFQKNVIQLQDEHYKDFTNVFIDDSGWWGLAWLRAYDLTGDDRYLEAARRVADFMWQKGWDDQSCGGGLLWEPEPRPGWPPPFTDPLLQQGKNAITSQLFIKLAAGISNRSPKDFVQRERARQTWEWFKGSAMVQENPDGLIWDALDWQRGAPTCHALHNLWAYTQGVLLGAIAELYRADPDPQLHTELLAVGDKVVAACLRRTGNSGQRFIYGPGPKVGILREKCEEDNNCWFLTNPYDQAIPSRGNFVRNLREYYDLNVSLGRSAALAPAAGFLKTQQATLLQKALSDDGRTFGISWTEKQPSLVSFLTQATAIDALTAAFGL